MPKTHWFSSRLIAGLVVALVAVLAAGSADAQNAKKPIGGGTALITGSSFDAIIEVLQYYGGGVELTTDSDGDPLIVSTDDELPFTVYFYGCLDGMDCEYIQFVSGWDLEDGSDRETIEAWNADRVWGRAFLDSENDPWLDLAVNLKGGVSVASFDDTVSWWFSIMEDFEVHIGFSVGDPG